MRTLASIDLGTNTCLLLIAEVDEKTGEVQKTLWDEATVVRLGEGVGKTKMLQTEAMNRAFLCLTKYISELQKFKVNLDDVFAVATSQARDAQNGNHFFKKIKNELGISFRILSGEEEAKASFLGSIPKGWSESATAVIDIGGGSTEIISAEGGQSIDVGSVRFTERFFQTQSPASAALPVSDEDFWKCKTAIEEELKVFLPWRKSLSPDVKLVAVAGTATTLAQWHLGDPFFSAEKIEGCILKRGDLHRMVEDLKWRTVKERESLPGVSPGRSDVLLAGALILWRTVEILDFPEVYVSTRGLRYGVWRAQKK